MQRLFLVAILVAPSLALAQYDPATVAKVREEIGLNETRAHQLEPIIARDTQARNDAGTDAAQLDAAARAMRARAIQFRQAAATLGPGPHQSQLTQTANELDNYAQHNEQMAAAHRDLASRLTGMIQTMTAGRDWHLAVAARLRQSLQDF